MPLAPPAAKKPIDTTELESVMEIRNEWAHRGNENHQGRIGQDAPTFAARDNATWRSGAVLARSRANNSKVETQSALLNKCNDQYPSLEQETQRTQASLGLCFRPRRVWIGLA
jgi:hypothetical protein